MQVKESTQTPQQPLASYLRSVLSLNELPRFGCVLFRLGGLCTGRRLTQAKLPAPTSDCRGGRLWFGVVVELVLDLVGFHCTEGIEGTANEGGHGSTLLEGAWTRAVRHASG